MRETRGCGAEIGVARCTAIQRNGSEVFHLCAPLSHPAPLLEPPFLVRTPRAVVFLVNCVHLSTSSSTCALGLAAARLARVYSETSMAAAELRRRRGSLEPNRASVQARHALRRAHIKAAAGDANATTYARWHRRQSSRLGGAILPRMACEAKRA